MDSTTQAKSLRKSNLIKRIITAIALIIIAAGTALLGYQYFIYLTHFFVLFFQIELARLFFTDKFKFLQIPFIVGCFLTTLVYNYAPFYFNPYLFLLIPTIFSLLLVGLSDSTNEDILKNLGLFGLGFLYVGLLPSIPTKILMIQDGGYWLILSLAVVFAGDVGAYFVGIKFGKKKVLPQISPNKTWEGCIGGLISSMAMAAFLGPYLFQEVNVLVFALSGCLASLLAQSGDFFESLIKRIAGKKDSGPFLPGHGGFLDRFDGLLFALPVFYYLAMY